MRSQTRGKESTVMPLAKTKMPSRTTLAKLVDSAEQRSQKAYESLYEKDVSDAENATKSMQRYDLGYLTTKYSKYK